MRLRNSRNESEERKEERERGRKTVFKGEGMREGGVRGRKVRERDGERRERGRKVRERQKGER
jgi:hypothetical protein